MEVLPEFELIQAAAVEDAVAALAQDPDARLLGGGTDLLPNMRRGLVEASAVVDISNIADLRAIDLSTDGSLSIGAAVTLDELARHDGVAQAFAAIAQAAHSVAGPSQRNMATVGGNICLDTRCIYYNQSEWWRRSNDYCLKYGGEICHVVPTSKRCYAAYSGDLAAALLLFDAEVEIADVDGRRRLPLAELFGEDGQFYLNLPKGALLVAVHMAAAKPGFISQYGKIRVRQSIDFPLAGVAIGLRPRPDGRVEDLRFGLTGVDSKPCLLDLAGADVAALDAAADAAIIKAVQKAINPLRTNLIQPQYRRRAIAAKALRLVHDLAAG